MAQEPRYTDSRVYVPDEPYGSREWFVRKLEGIALHSELASHTKDRWDGEGEDPSRPHYERRNQHMRDLHAWFDGGRATE